MSDEIISPVRGGTRALEKSPLPEAICTLDVKVRTRRNREIFVFYVVDEQSLAQVVIEYLSAQEWICPSVVVQRVVILDKKMFHNVAVRIRSDGEHDSFVLHVCILQDTIALILLHHIRVEPACAVALIRAHVAESVCRHQSKE